MKTLIVRFAGWFMGLFRRAPALPAPEEFVDVEVVAPVSLPPPLFARYKPKTAYLALPEENKRAVLEEMAKRGLLAAREVVALEVAMGLKEGDPSAGLVATVQGFLDAEEWKTLYLYTHQDIPIYEHRPTCDYKPTPPAHPGQGKVVAQQMAHVRLKTARKYGPKDLTPVVSPAAMEEFKKVVEGMISGPDEA